MSSPPDPLDAFMDALPPPSPPGAVEHADWSDEGSPPPAPPSPSSPPRGGNTPAIPIYAIPGWDREAAIAGDGTSAAALQARRAALGVRVTPPTAPAVPPADSVEELRLPGDLARRAGHACPTPIQAQAVPYALLGCDVLGVAGTGSGKTLAFLWPALAHVSAQAQGPAPRRWCPRAVVLSPTRELARQTARQAARLDAGAVATLVGGALAPQIARGRDRHGLLIATPGRLLEALRRRALALAQTSLIVLDEADRLLEMGFAAQTADIVGRTHPGRQILCFSATTNRRLDDWLGGLGGANQAAALVRVIAAPTGGPAPTTTQAVEVLAHDAAKWEWLAARLPTWLADDPGAILIFAGGRAQVQDLATRVAHDLRIHTTALHGELRPEQRAAALAEFRRTRVLIATDLAARGLHLPDVSTVLSYAAPRDTTAHLHRIGRAGRPGQPPHAIAYTLLTAVDGALAAKLLPGLKRDKQDVSEGLQQLAERAKRFRKSRGEM